MIDNDTSYPTIICFKTHNGRMALCEHHYLEDHEEGNCKTCEIPKRLSPHEPDFSYTAWVQPDEKKTIVINDDQECYINCEGIYSEQGCYFDRCKEFFYAGKDNMKIVGGCRKGRRPMDIWNNSSPTSKTEEKE